MAKEACMFVLAMQKQENAFSEAGRLRSAHRPVMIGREQCQHAFCLAKAQEERMHTHEI